MGKYAHSLDISDKITSPLNSMESWFDNTFGNKWEFSGCSDDDDDLFMCFANFVYANMSSEVVEKV